MGSTAAPTHPARRAPSRSATGRVALAAVVSAAVALGGTARRAGAQQQGAPPAPDSATSRSRSRAAGEAELGVYEVRVARLEAITVPALVRADGGVLVPLRRVLAVAGLRVERRGAELSVADLGGAGRATLDTASGRLVRRDTVAQLAPGDLAVADGEVYVLAGALAPLLRADVTVQPSELRVVLTRLVPFPAERDAQLAAARRAAAAAGDPATTPLVAYGRESGGAVIDWGVSNAGGDLRRSTGADARLGLALLGGELAGGGFYTVDALGTARGRGTASYRRVFPSSRVVRQIQVGDVVGGGALLRPLRGVVVTNTPLIRQSYFTQVPVLPAVPQGWQYEVYQGGQLVGYSDAASRAPVVVPLRYGTTPLQVRLLSPAGDEVVSPLLFQVPLTQLAPGAFEYSLGGGQCPDVTCRAGGFASAWYGVRRWLTAQAGVETTTDSLGGRVQPHAGVSVAALSGWAAQLQAMRGSFSRATAQYYGAGPLGGDVGVGINHPGSGQLAFVASAAPRWYGESHLVERLDHPWHGVSAVRFEGRVEGPSGAAADRWHAGLTADVTRARVGIDHQRSPDGEGVTSGSLLLITPRTAPRWLRNAALQTAAGGNDRGLRLADVSLALQAGRHGSLNAGWRWSAVGRTRSTSSLVYSTSLGFGRATSRLTSAAGGRVSPSSALSGSVILDRRSGVTAVDQGGVGNAGIAGTVFYDHDGDGRFGPGDAAAPGVRVFVGPGQARANARGEYQAWHEQPYEIAPVRVDTLGGLEPEWAPLTAVTLVRPTPHRFTRVDVPLVRTRELSGRVVAGAGVATAAGVTLTLEEVAGGASQSMVTFSDGEFYLSRVRPGEYTLRVDQSTLDALGAVMDGGAVRVTVTAQGTDAVGLPTIRLVAKGR